MHKVKRTLLGTPVPGCTVGTYLAVPVVADEQQVLFRGHVAAGGAGNAGGQEVPEVGNALHLDI